MMAAGILIKITSPHDTRPLKERPVRCGTLFALWLRRSAAAARCCMSGAHGAQFAPRSAFAEPAQGAAREMRIWARVLSPRW